MKRSMWLVGIAVAAAMLAGQAGAQNSQQEKMTACNNQATAKGLSGDQRQDYMSKCLSKGSSTSSTGNSQQQKMTDCNQAADKKSLTGTDRQNFMKQCLSKGGSAK